VGHTDTGGLTTVLIAKSSRSRRTVTQLVCAGALIGATLLALASQAHADPNDPNDPTSPLNPLNPDNPVSPLYREEDHNPHAGRPANPPTGSAG
jgi:hypothetical protein